MSKEHFTCPECGHEFRDREISSAWAKIAGRKKSERKSRASRQNGHKGGRPRLDKEAT